MGACRNFSQQFSIAGNALAIAFCMQLVRFLTSRRILHTIVDNRYPPTKCFLCVGIRFPITDWYFVISTFDLLYIEIKL